MVSFLGQGIFLEIRTVRKTFTYNTRKKESPVLSPESLQKFHFKLEILPIDDQNQGIFSPKWSTFYQILTKGQWRTYPPHTFLVTRLPYDYMGKLNFSLHGGAVFHLVFV